MWVPEDTYAITRMDLPGVGTHGWQVRLQRRGSRYRRFFSDSLHGGPRGSYDAALAWRDALKNQILAEDSGARVQRESARNSSGVIGVSKIRVVAANGAIYWFWQAAWCPSPGVRRYVKFSVKRHGDRQAFRLAVEARRDAIGE